MSNRLAPLLGVLLVALSFLGNDSAWGQTSRTPEIIDDGFPVEIEPELKISARYYLVPNKMEGFVIVRFKVPAHHHIYGVHQPREAPQTHIELLAPKGVQLMGKFRPDKTPKIKKDDPTFGTTIVEHTGEVQFYAPLKIPTGFNAAKASLRVRVKGQMCSDEGYCLPIMGREVPVRFAGFYQRQAKRPNSSPSGRK